MSEYYPFRQFLMPELPSDLLTHQLVPTITTANDDGRVSFWTVLSEVNRSRFEGTASGALQPA